MCVLHCASGYTSWKVTPQATFHNKISFFVWKHVSLPSSAKYQGHIQVLKETSTTTGIGGVMVIAQDTKTSWEENQAEC